jgi:transposase InsO family protein
VQYASAAYVLRLEEARMRPSMSAKGNPYDNAKGLCCMNSHGSGSGVSLEGCCCAIATEAAEVLALRCENQKQHPALAKAPTFCEEDQEAFIPHPQLA